MSAAVFTAEEAQKAKIELITETAKGRQAVHDVVVAMRANRRRGTAGTKTKGEVALSGAKPWRQKEPAAPVPGQSLPDLGWWWCCLRTSPSQLRQAHPPRRSRFSLSARPLVNARSLVMFSSSTPSPSRKPKTKQFISLISETAKDARKTLIVGTTFDEKTYLAARNVQNALLARAADVNTEQLLAFDKIVLTKEALATISERLAS